MKKIFLFLISGLVVLLFSGAATAGSINLGLDPADDGNYYIPSDTGVLDIPFTVSGLSTTTGTYTLMFTVTGEGLSAEIEGFGALTGVSSSDGTTYTHTFTYTGDRDGYIHLVRDSSSPAGTGTVQVIINKGDTTEVAASGIFAAAWLDIGIPEFPTLALPIAAILGLVFVFGRKKEGL